MICVSPEEDDKVAEKGIPAKRKCVQNVVKKTQTFVLSSPNPESNKFPSRFPPDLLDLLNIPNSVIILKGQSENYGSKQHSKPMVFS